MRQDYPEFQKRDAEVIAIGAAAPAAFQRMWKKEALPFSGVPDPEKVILKRFGQQFKWHKFGRMPAVVVVDNTGIVRWIHYGASASDIPANDDVIEVLDNLTPDPGGGSGT